MAKGKFTNAIGSVIGNIEENQALIDGNVNVKMLNIDELLDYPKQNEMFGEIEGAEYEALKENIEALGILDPIIVRKTNEKYEVLAGHRRKKAAIDLGLKEVPARIMNVNDIDAELIFLVTNTKNRVLGEMQLARAIKREKELLSEKIKAGELTGKASSHVAERLGMNTKAVERLDRLNRLIPELQEMVDKKGIAVGKAQELALLDHDTQKLMYDLMKEKLDELKIQEVQDLRKSLEDEKLELVNKLQEFESKLKQKDEDIDSANEEYQNLLAEYNKINQDAKSTKEEVEEFKKQMEEAKLKVDALTKEKEDMQSVESLKEELDKAKAKIIELEGESIEEKVKLELEQEKAKIQSEAEKRIEEEKEKARRKVEEEKEKAKKEYDKMVEEERKKVEQKAKEEVESFKKQLEEIKKESQENEYNAIMNDELLVTIKGIRIMVDNGYVQLNETIENMDKEEYNENCKTEFNKLVSSLNNFNMLKKRFEI